MAEWLGQVSQGHNVWHHDLAMEVMGSKPGRIELDGCHKVVLEPMVSVSSASVYKRNRVPSDL